MTKECVINMIDCILGNDILCDCIEDSPVGCNECRREAADIAINALKEPKTGKWVYKTTDAYIQRTCSACGWSERMYYRNRNQDGLIRNYCPNCGADMRGEEE